MERLAGLRGRRWPSSVSPVQQSNIEKKPGLYVLLRDSDITPSVSFADSDKGCRPTFAENCPLDSFPGASLPSKSQPFGVENRLFASLIEGGGSAQPRRRELAFPDFP